MANLIDLATYKSLVGVQSGDTRDDAQINALLGPVSRAIEVYTGRKFEVSTRRTTTRTYLYDNSGFLDIDDCTAITSISASVPNVDPISLAAEEFTAMGDGVVYYYVVIHGGTRIYATSPEMGFKRNLDQYPSLAYSPATFSVTATWGWPAIPEDVKLAAALTIRQFLTSSGGGASEGLSAEAIEGWSRSWGSRAGGTTMALAIPNRARDLLVAYQRVFA